MQLTNSFHRAPVGFSSETNGNFAKRRLVGGFTDRIRTVVCVPLTSNLRWASAPGNVSLSARLTGLPKDSVANVSQIVTLDRDLLTERVGKLPRAKQEAVLAGIDVVLGR